MKALCRYIAIGILLLLALMWIALQTDAGQIWAKAQVISQLEKATGYEVSLDKIDGIPPLFISLEKIEFFEKSADSHLLPIRKKVLSIESLDLAPTWFDPFFGRMSFFYLSAKEIDLTNLPDSRLNSEGNIDSLQALLPNIPFSAYVLNLSDISLPPAFSEPLLNDFHDSQNLNILYDIHGSLHWQPKKDTLNTTLTIIPSAADTSLGSLTIALNTIADKTDATIDVNAIQAPSGSVFISLPADQLSFQCNVRAATSSLLNALEKKSPSPLFAGTWHLAGIKQADKKVFASFMRFSADGTIAAKDINSLFFSTTAIACHELVPDMNAERAEQTNFLLGPHEPTNRGFLAIDKIITGDIQGSCHFSMPDNQPKIAIEVGCEHLRFEEIELASFSSSLAMYKPQKKWQGSFDLTSSIRQYGKNSWIPIRSSGDFSTDGHIDWEFHNLRFSVCEYPIEGNLQVALYPLVLQGKFSNRSSDISLLAKELGFAPQGKADFTIDFEPGSIKTVLSGQDLQCADFSKVQIGFASKILLDDKSPLAPFSLHLQGENKDKNCSLAMQGTSSLAEAKIDSLVFQIENNEFKNEQPIDLKFSLDKFTLEQLSLQSEKGGQVSAQWNQTKKTVQASLTADNFSLETLNPFLPSTALFGSVSGHLELTGATASPQISSSFASSEWYFCQSKETRSPSLMTSGRMAIVDGIFDGDLELQGFSIKRPIECSATFPLKFSLVPFSLAIPEKSDIQATLKGELELDSLFSSLGKETERVGGLVVCDVQAKGPLVQPQFLGQISWNQGFIHIPIIGCDISQIQMEARLDNEKLILDSITATDGKKGSITGTGTALLSAEQTLSYQLLCNFSDFEIINIDEATVTAKAETQLFGNIQGASLQGTAEVIDAVLLISPDLSSPLPELDITYINEENPTDEASKRFYFNLDLDIHMPGNGQISGMGLESEWKGDMHLAGKDKIFQLNGQLSAIKGILEFGNKKFALSQATIEFHGDPLSQSKLNVIASQNISHIATQIVLRGSLASPRIDFQSTPAMSQKEIISWILFNKSSSEISPFEGIQLAQILLKLKSNSQSFDLFEKLKTTIGIDRIDVGPSSTVSPQQQDPFSNEVTLQVGKYISEGVIVTLSKDVTNEANRIGIEANITKHIIAEANVGDDSETQLSLQWKLNY